jgi:hypothetical protein
MTKPSQTRLASIAVSDLQDVTGAGLPSLWALPIIVAGVAADNVVRGWGNQFSWKRQGPNGYE